MSEPCQKCHGKIDDWRYCWCTACLKKHNQIKSNGRPYSQFWAIAYVYALIDPRTLSIRYIGRTTFPEFRVQQHVDIAKFHPEQGPKRAKWINDLLSVGLRPELIILEQCSMRESYARERHWLLTAVSKNHPLTNCDRHVISAVDKIIGNRKRV